MTFKKYLVICLSAAFLISCGGEKKKEEEKESIKIGTSDSTTKKEESNEVNVALAGNDLMQFDKKEIKVKAGQKVTLTLRHTGKLDLLVMGHNFVLLKQGTSITEFGLAASTAGKDNDWIPDGGAAVIANTKMIGGGQSTSITFDAPAAGTYDFVCSFPGHIGTMQGKFIVE